MGSTLDRPINPHAPHHLIVAGEAWHEFLVHCVKLTYLVFCEILCGKVLAKMVTAVSNLCGLAQHRKLLVAVQLLVQLLSTSQVSLPAGCWLHQHWPQPSAVVHPLQSRPQVTRTSRHKSSCSNSRGHATQHGKSRKHGTESRKSSSAPVKPAQSAKPHDTLTAPMQVKVLAQLSKLEQAANPWWSTFCGVTNGLWLGQTAAFAPSTGTAVVRCTPFLSWQRHCNVQTDIAAWCCKCYLLQLYA